MNVEIVSENIRTCTSGCVTTSQSDIECKSKSVFKQNNNTDSPDSMNNGSIIQTVEELGTGTLAKVTTLFDLTCNNNETTAMSRRYPWDIRDQHHLTGL